MSQLIAIVAGVGPGTGAAVARKFATSYPVVLMARKPDSYNDLVKEINEKGGKAVGISTDVADAKSVKSAVGQIKEEFGSGVGAAVSCHRGFGMSESADCTLQAAIFNASGGFHRKPFLELNEEDFMSGLNVSV